MKPEVKAVNDRETQTSSEGSDEEDVVEENGADVMAAPATEDG
jgi:hypothetical protein